MSNGSLNSPPARWKDAVWAMITNRFDAMVGAQNATDAVWYRRLDAINAQLAAQANALDHLLAGVTRLENHLMTQDEAIQKIQEASDAMKIAVNAGVLNITADIKGLQDQLAALTDLSPANQAKVDALVSGFQQVADQVTALSNIVPDPAPVVEP